MLKVCLKIKINVGMILKRSRCFFNYFSFYHEKIYIHPKRLDRNFTNFQSTWKVVTIFWSLNFNVTSFPSIPIWIFAIQGKCSRGDATCLRIFCVVFICLRARTCTRYKQPAYFIRIISRCQFNVKTDLWSCERILSML